MNITNLTNTNPILRTQQTNKNSSKTSDEKSNNQNNNNINVSDIFSKNTDKSNKYSIVDLLENKKENMLKNMAHHQERLAELAKTKESYSYTVTEELQEDGTIVTKKVPTDENEEYIKEIESQEDALAERIKSILKEINGVEEEIRAAKIEEMQRNAEKEKAEKEKELKESKPEKQYATQEEKQQAAERKEMEFLTEMDTLQKYIQSGRITKAKLEQDAFYIKYKMAKDSEHMAFSEQRGLHSEFPLSYSPIPDTSAMKERARVENGQYFSYESDSVTELKGIESAINRTENNINSQIGKIIDKTEERQEEQEKEIKEKNKDQSEDQS